MIAAQLDRIVITEGATAALLGARIGGLVLAAPMFSSRAIPMRVRATVLVVLTLALLPGIEPVATSPSPLAFAAETGIGLVIGLAASLYIAGATAAGDLVAIQMGLAGSSTLNPISGESMPIVGHFSQLTALTVVLTLGGHVVMIEAVHESLALAPLGQPLAVEEGVRSLVDAAGRVFVIALRFAPERDPEALPWAGLIEQYVRTTGSKAMMELAGPDGFRYQAYHFETLREISATGAARALLPRLIGDEDPRLACVSDTILEQTLWMLYHRQDQDVLHLRAARSWIAGLAQERL